MRSTRGFRRLARLLLILAGTATLRAAPADDIVSVRLLSMELAREVATAAVEACRAHGYQVAAVVVDRSAIPQAVLRDVLAPRFTLQLAEEKANAVVLSGVSTARLARNRSDILAELNEVDGILVLRGGVPIRGAGSLLGAVGVSGAPGGDKDEVCALKGVEAIQEALDFLE